MRLISLFFALLVPSITTAEPTPTVRWAIQEEASLFSIGLLRLELEIKNLSKWEEAYTFEAEYLWPNNSINITAYYWDNDLLSKESCARILNRIRMHALVDPTKGKPVNDISKFAVLFQHFGFRNNEEPNNYLQEIDKLFYLTVVSVGDGVICEAPLHSTKILYTD